MAEEKKRRNRIGLVSTIFMPVVAIIFDIFSFIPFVGALGWIVFTIWFFLLGISPFTIKRLATMISSTIIELIPWISLLPSVTIGVIVIIIMIKSEDALGVKLPLSK